MAYVSGLGFEVSASASTSGGSSDGSGGGGCISEAEHDKAVEQCKNGSFLLALAACAQAKKRICAPALAVQPMVIAPPKAPPPEKASAPAPPKRTLPRKLPVPAAEPIVMAPPSMPPPTPDAPGVPIWVWIAGGVLVLGTGAVLYTRSKKG